MHETPPTLEMNSKQGNHTHGVLLSIPLENIRVMTLYHNHSRTNAAAAEYNCRVEKEKKKIEFESSLAGRQKSVMKSALGFAKRGVKASSECQNH